MIRGLFRDVNLAMMRSGRVFVWVLVLGVALVGCGGGEDAADMPGGEAAGEGADSGASAMAVSLVAAQRGALPRTVTASGPVSAWEEVSLGVELSGQRVSEVLVDVGDAVAKGDVLLRLDDRTTRSELQQAEASANEAEAGAVLALTQLERGRALRDRKLLAEADFETLAAQRVQADARQATAKAQRDAAALRLGFTELRAPDAGVIAKRSVRPGQVVSAGSELLTLIRQNRLEWRAELSERDLIVIEPGLTVALTAPGGGRIDGLVRAVSPAIDATTRTATIYVDLPEPGLLRAGMYVEGRIELGSSTALTLPRAAVVRRDGFSYVFGVAADNRVSRKRVDVGRLVDDRIEILSGLADDERVVERGAGFLSDGDRVRVVDASSPELAAPATAETTAP